MYLNRVVVPTRSYDMVKPAMLTWIRQVLPASTTWYFGHSLLSGWENGRFSQGSRQLAAFEPGWHVSCSEESNIERHNKSFKPVFPARAPTAALFSPLPPDSLGGAGSRRFFLVDDTAQCAVSSFWASDFFRVLFRLLFLLLFPSDFFLHGLRPRSGAMVAELRWQPRKPMQSAHVTPPAPAPEIPPPAETPPMPEPPAPEIEDPTPAENPVPVKEPPGMTPPQVAV